jgi:hypothetical protein
MRLTGNHVAFRTAADRRALVGRYIMFLRHCDIDRTGRGMFFPRTGIVQSAGGRFLNMDNGTSLAASDLVEVVDLGAAE